jgi:hypothetical protein
MIYHSFTKHFNWKQKFTLYQVNFILSFYTEVTSLEKDRDRVRGRTGCMRETLSLLARLARRRGLMVSDLLWRLHEPHERQEGHPDHADDDSSKH